ncbi:MAG TPA: hypothetical protein PKA90_16700 [Ignavibacteria bacterium]|nr:hypothetical protein [Ignavibacteria bacterium]HMR42057.1 hypothetical protein [Ignavibacteria bacterium]
MIKNQKNKYAMYDAVSAFLEEKSSNYSGNEEFTEHVNSFKASVNAIELKEDLRNKSTRGKVIDKNINRGSVTDQALAVAGALYAMAKKNGNVTLLESVKYTKSGLNRFRDTGLVIELNSIKEKAVEYSEAISRFGISSDSLAEFTGNIKIYEDALAAKASGGATKSGAVKSLMTLFRESDNILDSIDRLMENYKVSKSEFYDGYKTSRVIKDLGIRHKGENSEGGDSEPAQLNQEQ